MTFKVPIDIELTFQYRDLVRELGVVKAAFFFQRLWADLAYQARAHGKCGVYRSQYLAGFCDRMKDAGVENATDVLVRCGFAKTLKDGSIFVPLFLQYNHNLDGSYLPPSREWERDWIRHIQSVKEVAPQWCDKIPRAAWYRTNGDIIPETTMLRALSLIHGLDIILNRNPRPPEKLEIGVIHAACDAAAKHKDLKLVTVMKRLMSLCRPRNHPLAPPTTEQALEDFDSVIVFACPDEGFESWVNRVENPEENEEEQIARSISDELRELSRVPAQ